MSFFSRCCAVVTMLVIVAGVMSPQPAEATGNFLADLRNSRQIDIFADKIAIYLAKADPARDRVVILYPYTRLIGGLHYQLDHSRTRFRFKYIPGGQALVVNGESFPVNVRALPQPPSTRFDMW